MKIYRPSLSKYYPKNFRELEREMLESLNPKTKLVESYQDDIEILITDTHVRIDDLLGQGFKNLKLIVHPNSGHDNISNSKLLSCPVILGNEIRAHGVSNYILNSLLNHFSKIPRKDSWDEKRLWQRKLLKDQNVQIIGHGHIGPIVENSLAPLVKNIFIHDPQKGKEDLQFENSDAIILCCSLNDSSFHLIDEDVLTRCKSDVLLINPARGKVIKEDALISHLKNNPSSFAYLDVFETEPCDFSKFPSNCKLSSHIAGVSDSLAQDTLNFESRVISDFLGYSEEEFISKYEAKIL